MPAVCRITDPINCGDQSNNGSPNVFTNNLATTRIQVDLTLGHCFNPTPIATGSQNVFINNIPVSRVNDPIIPHTCPPNTHGGEVAAGSPNVFANNGGGSSPGEQPATPVSPPSNDSQPEIRPWISNFEGGTAMDDDEDEDDGLAIYPRAIGTPTPSQIQESIDNGFDPNSPPPPIIEEENVPTVVPDVPVGCGDIDTYFNTVIMPGESSFHPNHNDFSLSTNYVLGDLTINPVVSTYRIIEQNGLTEVEIVCNLRNLTQNIIEPFKTYLSGIGKILQINSGFRHGGGTSQHNKGQAVDIQVPGFTNQEYWDTAVWIKDNLPYDQFILEYGGSRPWFHISFDIAGNRTKLTTRTRPGSYISGLKRIL